MTVPPPPGAGEAIPSTRSNSPVFLSWKWPLTGAGYLKGGGALSGVGFAGALQSEVAAFPDGAGADAFCRQASIVIAAAHAARDTRRCVRIRRLLAKSGLAGSLSNPPRRIYGVRNGTAPGGRGVRDSGIAARGSGVGVGVGVGVRNAERIGAEEA